MKQRNLWLRRISQALFLGLWVFLFWKTAHQDVGPLTPDLFLATDPLVALLTMAAGRIWVPAMIGATVLVGLTLVFGRFFCGWICPLGTVIDVVGRIWHGRKQSVETRGRVDKEPLRRAKYYILAALAVASMFGAQQLHWFDPLVFSFRAVAVSLVPSSSGQGAFLSLALLLTVIGLVGIKKRFWCRYLCPLGAFYAALSRFSIFRRRVEKCDGCKGEELRACQCECGMEGSPVKHGCPEECIRCMSCQAVCSNESVSFKPALPLPVAKENVILLERRTFVVSLGAGALTGLGTVEAGAGTGSSWRIVRPPMVADNGLFSALCVRCGQCIRSCPTGTLQPLLLEDGFAGLWTPAITPHVGGCEDDCNACSGACPTGAIPKFGPSRPQKWAVKMGQVAFESSRCITYAPDAVKYCLKCVEACPNKAIVVDMETKPERPVQVIYDRCVGCGLCETACLKMVFGPPALTLTSNGVGSPTLLVADPKPKLP